MECKTKVVKKQLTIIIKGYTRLKRYKMDIKNIKHEGDE